MSELQLGLIGLGTIAVIGVFAYNKWQEHRHRKLAERVLQHGHADVLLDGHRESEAPRSVPPRAVDVADDEPRLVPMMTAERAAHAHQAARQEPSSVRMEPALEPLAPEGDQPAKLNNFEDHDLPVLSEPVAPAEPFLAEPPPAASIPAAAPRAEPPHAEPFSEPVSGPVSGLISEPTPRSVISNGGEDEVPPIIVSPAIDYMASFELVEPISGDQILRSQRDLLARISKPVGWAGFNDRSCEWERVVEEGNYRRLRVGLLLADRRGPLGEADLLTFHGAMQNLAEELMAVADLPQRDAALNAAIALDQFCANVDIQVGVNVISRGQVFPGTKIRALAEAAGMVLDSSGRFVRCDDDGNVLYTLANQESVGFSAESMKTLSTHGLVFILDVPRVSRGDRVFAQMLDLARRMADTLHGVLVDDNRRPLTESMLDPFRRQIGQYQSQLAAKGLPAGSPLTQRLFS